MFVGSRIREIISSPAIFIIIDHHFLHIFYFISSSVKKVEGRVERDLFTMMSRPSLKALDVRIFDKTALPKAFPNIRNDSAYYSWLETQNLLDIFIRCKKQYALLNYTDPTNY